jgi:hypothetical protein
VFEVCVDLRRWIGRRYFVAGKYAGNTDNFVELKTSLSIRGPQDEAKFEK